MNRVNLSFQISFAGSACIIAALHSIMSVENFVQATSVITTLSGVHAALVGLYAFIKPGNISGECNAAAKGYDHIIQRIQMMLMDPELDVPALKEYIKEIEQMVRNVMHAVGYQPPKWVLDEVSNISIN